MPAAHRSRTGLAGPARVGYRRRVSSLRERLRRLLSPAARADERNITSLAERLCLPREDASWIYRRSREVGFGAAMSEYEARRDDAQATPTTNGRL